ncbi:putative diphthamide synthesis protein-domain-containing protein [Pholiota molesta]|nr:putative diphthamide synthesis protein-domain-containing protein [Pholiota molesta]
MSTPNNASSSTASTSAARPRKRFVGSKSSKPSKPGVQSSISNQIPPEILQDAQLNAAIKQLPSNYSFEIHKTIHHVRKNNATMVALQMPEGLQMFACTIADIIERFTNALTVIMGDVTYGACCIDDYTAVALGCDMLIHYGHSCLGISHGSNDNQTLYVFVEIGIDSAHLAQTIRMNFPDDRELFHRNLLDSEEANAKIPIGSIIGTGRNLQIEDSSSNAPFDDEPVASSSKLPTRLSLVSTIQFVAALQRLKEDLSLDISDASKTSKPLSPGEILGCTAPRLQDIDALIYLGDGHVPAFRYDPYSKKLTRERYNHQEMQAVRDDAVQAARKSIKGFTDIAPSTPEDSSPLWGVILGTLGRQGNLKQMQAVTHQLEASKSPIPYLQILLSELSPAKLALFNPHISTFIQTSCPRLSIDWGYAFEKPL